jgi:hypothetical protein
MAAAAMLKTLEDSISTLIDPSLLKSGTQTENNMLNLKNSTMTI